MILLLLRSLESIVHHPRKRPDECTFGEIDVYPPAEGRAIGQDETCPKLGARTPRRLYGCFSKVDEGVIMPGKQAGGKLGRRIDAPRLSKKSSRR
jgi:hypothetical protein